jgi:DNA polymerase elongation subunit (family B)
LIANTAGKMVCCLEQPKAMSVEKWVDLSMKSGSDIDNFERGYVLEPISGCYKGVLVINGNSLYGSIIVELGMFVDRCISAPTRESLLTKIGARVASDIGNIRKDDSVELPVLIVIKMSAEYLGIISLSKIIKALIPIRKRYKPDGDEVTAGCGKVLTTGTFGVFGSKHGDTSSKTCAKITTSAAGSYLRMVISVARACGYLRRHGFHLRRVQGREREGVHG